MGDLSGTNDKLDDSPAMEMTGKIMVAAIIILFFVVVVVCFLHLYARWFWWRIEGGSTAPHLRHSHSRRRRRRRFVFSPGQDPPIYGAQRSGLDPEVLRSIPILVYQPEDFKDGLECAVCLCELEHGEKARLLPKCNHGFHVDCIDMWFHSHSTCPLCRNPVASESFKSCCSTGVRENASESNSQSSDESESSDAMSEINLESPSFPTNVLIWGNQTSVSSVGVGSSMEEGTSSSSSAGSSSSSNNNNNKNNINRRQGMLVIDIPNGVNPSSLSPSTSRFAEDDLKSPMTSRLKSLTRILSLKFSPRSPSSTDVEQGRGQS